VIAGLLLGFAIAGAICVVWLAVEDFIKRELPARRQAKWDCEIEQAVRLSETPIHDALVMARRDQRGAGVVAYSAVGVAVVLLLGALFVGARLSSEKTLTCTVTDKDRTTKVTSDGNGGMTSSSDARIYTEDCGTLQVTDELFKGHFTSADTYAAIEPGHRYDFTVLGWRIGFFSEFPNIIEATEVDR
jgi:hypothetical protein